MEDVGGVVRGLEGAPDQVGVPDREDLGPCVDRQGLLLSGLGAHLNLPAPLQPQFVDVAHGGYQVKKNRAVISPSGWAAKSANPDTTTLPGNTPRGKDPLSCDEFAYTATCNSGGMPAPDGLKPVSSGEACVQTYTQRTQTDV